MAVLVESLEAGGSRSAALKSDGTVTEWGAINIGGQVGFPSGLSSATALSVGWEHALARKSDGTVVGWGGNNSGQVTIPSGLNDVVAVSAGGSFSLALKSDGTVVGWGNNINGQAVPPAGLPQLDAIAAGWNHSLGITTTGAVVGWGNDGFDNYIPPSGLTNVTAISTNRWHSLAVKSDGTVVGWGLDDSGQASPPAGLSDVIAVSAGYEFSLALKSDGTVVGWGLDGDGQATPPPGLTGVVAISAGQRHGLALKSDGTVVGWGYDVDGQATPPLSIQPPAEGDLAATLSFSAEFADVTGYSGNISAPIALSSSFSAFQDWLSKTPPTLLQETYRLIITGAQDGVQDLAIGQLSSWQATNQAGARSSYLQAVIPAADSFLPQIEARQNGELAIQKGYKFSDGSVRFEEIMRSRFDSLRSDRGGQALTLTLSGYLFNKPASFGARKLTGIRSISAPNGKRRVRCDVDTFLQPGMTVTALEETFTADFINYYVSQFDKFCEVSER